MGGILYKTKTGFTAIATENQFSRDCTINVRAGLEAGQHGRLRDKQQS